MTMCLRRPVYGLRRHGIKLIKSWTVRILALFAALLMLGLASRVATEANKSASLKLTGPTVVYFPAANAAAWAHEKQIALGTRHVLPTTSAVLSIQDIVLLPDDILLLIPLPEQSGEAAALPPKEHLTCLFDNTITTSLAGLEYSRGRALVRCRPPKTNNITSATLIASSNPTSSHSLRFSGEVKHALNHHGSLVLDGLRVVASLAHTLELPVHVKAWHYLVFEMWATKTDVVLFAKGINKRQGHNVRPDELVCMFGSAEDVDVVETKVSTSAQEVFRCAHPPSEHRSRLTGKPVTLRWGAKMLPTVAYYEEISRAAPLQNIPAAMQNHPVATEHPSEDICACTMVFNVAKFLPEWTTFHSHMGVDRFILYDNNSEDDLADVLERLRHRQFQVSRYPWPWPKTQEAGFSHCVMVASETCQWVVFADVDEFVFPAAYLPPSGRVTPLRQLIEDAERRPRKDTAAPAPSARQNQTAPRGIQGNGPLAKVGQISIKCRDFGPSNLTQHPTRGVTQGYVCRSKKELRHKSLVRPNAISPNLQNVVHHFNLQPRYVTVTEHLGHAVVNHYKYQAWPEFRQKFRRRVSAYVSDWKEQRNLESRDRTPGLGAREEKPPHWETAFCDVSDTALRDYCHTIFTINSSKTSTLAWQLI
ncbi:hypothetical protein L7F22_048109 [Adiantum nelumboides]|nr:hypothetical protein [Adiantum nelumboides]